MTERDKVTVDDIIGLVHTDEMTNSVEEVRKLRGRTNERFKLADDYLIEYDGDYFDLHKPSDIRSLVTVIKYVTDENEQLKSKNRGLQSELQIFKEDVTHSNLQINKLADENEKLKKEIAHLKNRLAYKDQHNNDDFRGIEEWARGGF